MWQGVNLTQLKLTLCELGIASLSKEAIMGKTGAVSQLSRSPSFP